MVWYNRSTTTHGVSVQYLLLLPLFFVHNIASELFIEPSSLSRGIFVAIAVFVLFLLYREYLLRKNNSELRKVQNRLLHLNETLEAKVNEATADLNRAQELSKIGSWVYNITKDELRWSKQTYKIFELNPKDIKNLYDATMQRIEPQDCAMVAAKYRSSLKEQKSYSLRHRLRMDDGSIKHVSVKCETSFTKKGEPLISYGTIQDITDQVLLELRMKKKDALMLHQSRLAQMGEMLSMIAHQWKQPLGSISAMAINLKVVLELEKYDLSRESQRREFVEFLEKNIENIFLNVEHMSTIIDSFKNFYKPNKAAQMLSLDNLVRHSYTLIAESLEALSIEVKFDLNAPSLVEVHESEFMQVILNLIINAKEQLLEKAPKKPRIFIQSYENIRGTYLIIRDNGGGIDKDIIEYIFDPYFSTKEEKNGTGLGLYMSKIIINEYHNARLVAANTKEGAEFSISFLHKIDIETFLHTEKKTSKIGEK